mgnify:FL=1
MDVILTHEQADFDALAALLAASLLNPAASPVLPVRINRNARKFINLYSPDLPFLEPRDLPSENIDSITLVDTQSLITLKGITRNTRIIVVDHHQLRPDLPVNWTIRIEKTGATTTLLVEELEKHEIAFSQIQATLLLLGIYEDTGSLTYASTTVRDAQAVVFLLEKGASLRIAAEYLNPALSNNQRLLAEELMEKAQTCSIQGKNVLLSQADARNMDEEISSVAHKLRDLLDPDALFLLVHTREGIRIIARSTSDDINVAKILIPFGGGGHERAASALLAEHTAENEKNLAAITEKLLAEIKSNVQPAVTVSKIMSKKPLLLSPETTLAEAERVMQRYGYEGYPVVSEGKVVGLLTRRAVDRAQHHRLNLSVSSLMESGEYSLLPNQSIDHVQDLMASTGWGQIPVLDPASEKIIGIVTRTDLLKNLMPLDKSRPKTENYAGLIEKALPVGRLALLKNIIEAAGQEHQALYIVGGFVRDLILRIPSQDFDIVVEGDAIKLAHLLAARFGGRVISHRRFGTAKWQIKDVKESLIHQIGCGLNEIPDLPESLDLISARTEFYDHPTALPVVETSSIKQDLHRRDFTINTLALRLDGSHFGELQDHWGGLIDLKKKQVKVLHSLSFVDDPTRMLRAVRFEQRFGFHIETRTRQLLDEALENLKQVSGDRIRHEIDLIFKEIDPCKVLDRLMELGLLSAVHPGLTWKTEYAPAVQKALSEDIVAPWTLPTTGGNMELRSTLACLVWLSALAKETALSIGRRLHFSNTLLDALAAVVELRVEAEDLSRMPASQFTERLSSVPEISVFALFCGQTQTDLQSKILTYLDSWRKMEPFTTGETLKSLGIPPGPRYAAILKELKAARLDGLINDQPAEEAYLEKLLES